MEMNLHVLVISTLPVVMEEMQKIAKLVITKDHACKIIYNIKSV
jgi:hypothetical protein